MVGFDNSYSYSDSFSLIESQWDLIYQSYTDFIKDSLVMISDKDEKIRRELRELAKNEPEELVYSYFEDVKRNIYTYRSVFLNASLLFIFSHFENTMRLIENETERLFPVKKKSKCSFCKNKGKSDKLQEIKQRIIKAAELKDQVKDGLNENWMTISDFYQIRNKLTHNDGRFDDKKKNQHLVRRIKKVSPTFSYSKEQNKTLSVYISDQCLKTVSTLMDSYLKTLMDGVWESYKANKA